MNGLSRDDVLRMAEEAGITNELIVSGWGEHWIDMPIQLERFANLVAAAEREKVARWMMTACYATGHGDTTEDLLRELAWQADERIAKAVAAEREACAKVCDAHKNPIDDPAAPVGQYESGGYIMAEFLADAIRARGSDAT